MKEPVHLGRGTWRTYRYDEIVTIKDGSLNIIDRATAIRIATELFIEKWERNLKDFKDWCGVTE